MPRDSRVIIIAAEIGKIIFSIMSIQIISYQLQE